MMTGEKKAPRKQVPEQVAVIDADRCTGCEACVEVCPVDCIDKIHPYPDAPGLQAWCEVDWDRCIGCRLCIRLPRPPSDPYTLCVCPWDAIEMIPLAGLTAAVDAMGGLPAYAAAHRERLLAAARH
jgi:Na+-translocating ferredoxin:NAD+ oxidoreductase subunit B